MTIGRGAVIAAGVVVNASVSPHSILSVISRHLKFRFSIDDILQHECILYPEDQRYTREEREKIFAETYLKGKNESYHNFSLS